jgi:hypothetical protein
MAERTYYETHTINDLLASRPMDTRKPIVLEESQNFFQALWQLYKGNVLSAPVRSKDGTISKVAKMANYTCTPILVVTRCSDGRCVGLVGVCTSCV